MKFPSKKIVKDITQYNKQKEVRIKDNAASLLILHHWAFIKELANAADINALRQKKTQIEEEDVDRVAPKVLLTFNEYEKVRKFQRLKNVASTTSSSSSSKIKVQPSPNLTSPKSKTKLPSKGKVKLFLYMMKKSKSNHILLIRS
ncbi:hypothetical protein Pmani_013937 [Petrolisthes manimaculis]|uniref:Uncharacterized protein n=1 Tax=Petrolisthes manimaculis TaxID=1843537 RepID=A0AAE1PU20_9EUCA|nr:hypothetical protein Pmani_013937 [Petrolisthes manimaculis]